MGATGLLTFIIAIATLTPVAHGAPPTNVLQLFQPLQAFQCQDLTISWQGGVPDYNLTIISDHVEEFSGISGTTFQWLVDVPSGSPVAVSLMDSTGTSTDSPLFQVANGSGTSNSCLQPSSAVTSSVASVVSSASPPKSTVPVITSTPTLLSGASSAPSLPAGAVAGIALEAALLLLAIAGLLVLFVLDRKDRVRRSREASPIGAQSFWIPVRRNLTNGNIALVLDLLESPRGLTPNPWRASQSTAAASLAPQASAKRIAELREVKRGATVRSVASHTATIQSSAPTPTEATVVHTSPTLAVESSPPPSIRFGAMGEVRWKNLPQSTAQLDSLDVSSSALGAE